MNLAVTRLRFILSCRLLVVVEELSKEVGCWPDNCRSRRGKPEEGTGVHDVTHSWTKPGVEVIVKVKPGRPLLSAGRDFHVGIGAALLAVEMVVVKVVGPDRVVVVNDRVGLGMAHHKARAGYVDDRCCAAEETVREEAPAVPRAAVCQTNHHGHHRYRLSVRTRSNVKDDYDLTGYGGLVRNVMEEKASLGLRDSSHERKN